MLFQVLVKDITTKEKTKDVGNKDDKLKGNVVIEEVDLSQKADVLGGSDNEIHDAELEAYMEEGENAGGEFPINKDIMLRQDMLSKHLVKLLESIRMNLDSIIVESIM